MPAAAVLVAIGGLAAQPLRAQDGPQGAPGMRITMGPALPVAALSRNAPNAAPMRHIPVPVIPLPSIPLPIIPVPNTRMPVFAASAGTPPSALAPAAANPQLPDMGDMRNMRTRGAPNPANPANTPAAASAGTGLLAWERRDASGRVLLRVRLGPLPPASAFPAAAAAARPAPLPQPASQRAPLPTPRPAARPASPAP